MTDTKSISGAAAGTSAELPAMLAAMKRLHAYREVEPATIATVAAAAAELQRLTMQRDALAARLAIEYDSEPAEHLYAGDCPDDDQPDARDPARPACLAMLAAAPQPPAAEPVRLLADESPAAEPLPTIRTGRYRHYKGGEYRVLGVAQSGGPGAAGSLDADAGRACRALPARARAGAHAAEGSGMSATEKIMDEVRALVVLDVTPESPGQLAALRHTIARTIGGLERARDAALEERNRLGVELTGARTRIADLETRAAAAAAEMMAWADRDAERDQRERAHREMALRAMAEAYDLRAEAERLRAVLCDIDRQLGHDDRDDAIREQITEAISR